MKTPILFRTLLLVAVLVSFRSLRADPVSEMETFSVFGKVDPADLAKGEIKTAAGTPMSAPRDLSVQGYFAIPKTPAQVIQSLRQFDPTAHRELKVFLHSDLSASPSAANFAKLANPPASSAVKALTAATEKLSPELQISQAEAKKFTPGKPVFGFWTNLLLQRAKDFVAGGAKAQASYDHTPAATQPSREISELVRQQPRVAKQFSAFLGSTGLMGGKGSLKPELYWELLQVEDDGVLTLGATYTRPASGGSYQVADGLYYASGGYNVALTFYQIWPMQIGGRSGSLVWRGDFISAASLGDLHGIERLAAESAMKKDILKATALFQNEAAR